MTAAPPEAQRTPQQWYDEWTTMLGYAAGRATGRDDDWRRHSSYSGEFFDSSMAAEGRPGWQAWMYWDQDNQRLLAVHSFDVRMALWNLARGGFDRAHERAAMEGLFENQLRMMPQRPDLDAATSPRGGDRTLSEGVIGIVVRERTDAFLDHVGVTQRVPGIRSNGGPAPERQDQHHAEAVNVLLNDIEAKTSQSREPLNREGLLNDLLRADPRQAVRTLAERVVDSTLVGRDHPETGWLVGGVLRETDLAGRQDAIDRVATAIGDQLAGLEGAQGSPQELAQLGLDAGRGAAGALDQQMRQIVTENAVRTPVGFYQHVLAQQGKAAETSMQADHTSYTGWQTAEPGQPSVSGFDGTQHLHQQHVLDPLRQLAENRGQQQSVEALTEQKQALQQLFEQNLKMLSGTGRDYSDSQHIFGGRDETGAAIMADPASDALSSGLAKDIAWNDREALNDYIRELGALPDGRQNMLEACAPGLTAIELDEFHTPETIAAHEFAHGLSDLTHGPDPSGRAGRDMAIGLVGLDPVQQWSAAAQELMAKHGLDKMITDPTQRLAAQTTIAESMKRTYGSGVSYLQAAEKPPTMTADQFAEAKRISSISIGREAARQGDSAARQIVQQVMDPELARVRAQALGQTVDASRAPTHAAATAQQPTEPSHGAKPGGAHRAAETKGNEGGRG
jgi:hypothetical protein